MTRKSFPNSFSKQLRSPTEPERPAVNATAPTIPEGFWPQIKHQLTRIAALDPSAPVAFDAVRTILLDPAYDEIQHQIHLNGTRLFDANTAFFAGSGGDATIGYSLFKAGWVTVDVRASYYYVMQHEATGEVLSYTEGDLQRGNLITI